MLAFRDVSPPDSRKNHLLTGLPDGGWQRWSSWHKHGDMPLGQVLYESGTALNPVYVATTPIVSLLYVMENGASAKLAFGPRRTLDVTSRAEIVLASPVPDAARSALGKLFVETKILQQRQVIVCTRHPRDCDEPALAMFLLLKPPERWRRHVSYETDCMRFLVCGRTTIDSQMFNDDAAVSGNAGAVLDPMAALRCRMDLDPVAGIEIVARSGWFAARPSGTEDIYKVFAESFSGAEHLQRILQETQTIVDAAISPADSSPAATPTPAPAPTHSGAGRR